MAQALEFPIFLPNYGMKLDVPSQFLDRRWSPYSRNMELVKNVIRGRGGFDEFDVTVLSGPVLKIAQFWYENGSYDLFIFTTKDIYKYDFGSSHYDIVTPQYSTGVMAFTMGSDKVYGGVNVDNCDDGTIQWADGSAGDVTPSRDTVDFKDGTSSVKLTVAASAGVELLAYHDISSLDMSAYDSVGFWIKSSVNTSAGDLQFKIDDTSACASALETIDIPALTANTWTWVNLTLSDPSLLTAVISIGIYQAVDIGACTINIDQIVMGDLTAHLAAGDYVKQGSGSIDTTATWYEVDSVDSDTEFTLTANFAEASANQSAYVARLILSGSTDDIWDGTEFFDTTLGNIYVCINGVDGPHYIEESGTAFAPIATLPTGFTTAKYVRNFFNRLVYLATVEGGENLFFRVRWGLPGDYDGYDDLDFNDLDNPTAANTIKGAYISGDEMIIPKEAKEGKGGAYTMRPSVSDDDFNFSFEEAFEGSEASFSTQMLQSGIVYFGSDGKFRNWSRVKDDPIFLELAPFTEMFPPNNSVNINSYRISHKSQIRWLLPYYNDEEGGQPFIVYDYVYDHAEVWIYKVGSSSNVFRCIGEFLNTSDRYVDDPEWTDEYVDEHYGFWDDVTFLDNAPIILYGAENGVVYRADYGTDDNATSYERKFRIAKSDFNQPSKYKRLAKQRWWFESESAGSVSLKFRKDDNNDFDSVAKTLSLASTSKEYKKVMVRMFKRFHACEFELVSTDHFGVLGVENFYHPRRTVVY